MEVVPSTSMIDWGFEKVASPPSSAVARTGLPAKEVAYSKRTLTV
jgi:hypothetical protein